VVVCDNRNIAQSGSQLSKIVSVGDSDWQGYGKPSGLEGKGSKGKGQGSHLATLEKPLPLPRVSRV